MADRDKMTIYCSFCGKSQHEVRKIIAGPNVFICNEETFESWNSMILNYFLNSLTNSNSKFDLESINNSHFYALHISKPPDL